MRKGIIAAIVAVALFAVGAFAATFNVTTEDVASGTDEFTECATSVDVEFTTGAYDGTLGAGGDFPVTQAVATFSGAGCDGKAATLAVLGDDGETIGSEFDVNVVGTTATFPITPNIPVADVFGSAVLVEGTPIP